jgi:hypothetical protein
MRRIARSLTVLALLAGLVSAAAPAPAFASCVRVPDLRTSIDAAPVVFVGTVVGVTNGGRWARVRVERVWKGTVASAVEVHGSPASEPGVMTSADRIFEVGDRDLFVPFGSRDPYDDNACSATRGYDSSMDSLAPAGAHAPLPAPAGPPAWLLAAVLAAAMIVVAAAAVMVVAGRRRRA